MEMVTKTETKKAKLEPTRLAAKELVKSPASKPAAPASAKESKARYYDLKRRVLGWEKDNYTKLAVLDAGKGWYKMFDHSAIIYACQIAKRLSLKAELISDTDFELTSDAPVLLFRELDKFEERLKRLKILRESADDGVYVFGLGYKVDACDLVMMQRENEMLRERANRLVLPKEVFPGLRNELRLLAMGLYEAVRKMNPVAREMLGNDLIKISAKIFENFVEAANGHIDKRQYLKTTIKDLRRIDAKLLLMSDLRLVEDNRNYQLILQVGKAQKKVAAAMLKIERRMRDENDF